MESQGVVFKVFLNIDDYTETRKFVVDDVSVITSFIYVKGKLAMVFPKLNNIPFKITWKDTDGDEITIDSDDDLVMAFTEMSGPVKVLYVTASSPQQTNQCRTYNVICDGCNKQITGYRYKCLQCPDFDLCADCEQAGHHKEHYMLRTSNGELPFSGACRKISENINRGIRKAQSMACKEAYRNAKASKKFEKKFDHHSKYKCGYDASASFYQFPRSVVDFINAAASAAYNDLPGYQETQQPQQQQTSEEHQTAEQSQSQTSQPKTSQQSSQMPQQSSQIPQQSSQMPQQSSQIPQQSSGQNQPPNFVEMMVKALSNIFPEAAASSSADYPMKAPTPTPVNEQSQPEAAASNTSFVAQTPSPMEEDVDPKNPLSKNQSWTLIDHDIAVQDTPREEPQPTAPVTPPLDQKILDGLKQLKDMGFGDHPDLIALLKRYDGNVGFVIRHMFDNI